MINFKGKKMRYSAFLKLKRKDCFIVDLPYGGEMMAIESDELRRGMEMLNLPFTDDMVNYGDKKEPKEKMKKNPKIVDIMSGCGKRTALKFGFLYLVENGKKNPKVETKEFQMVLGEEVISRIMKNRCESIETEIFENMIASLEENTYSNPSERAFMKKKIQEYKQMLEKKDPLVTYNGGKTRYSKLDLQKCSVEQKPSGEYVANDLDPKEIAKAEKKKEQNRKKREKQKMKKMAEKEGFHVDTVDEVDLKEEQVKEEKEEREDVTGDLKRCMDAINNIV
uniref:SAM_MT_RSMB_NOP domain-containing protein n=1 Tax=Caenorhabditis tropicalis TaxID=1561998 RepID=A0A1I7TUD0_9PELO